jgi:hypothetical protein
VRPIFGVLVSSYTAISTSFSELTVSTHLSDVGRHIHTPINDVHQFIAYHAPAPYQAKDRAEEGEDKAGQGNECFFRPAHRSHYHRCMLGVQT